MRLYPKKLKNISALEREKRNLLEQKKELDKEDLFSFGSIASGLGSGDGGEGGSLIDMLPISNPIVSSLLKTIYRRFSERKRARSEEGSERQGSSVLKKIAKEFIGGYLKWKAIELSYKGIKLIIKKSRSKEKDQ